MREREYLFTCINEELKETAIECLEAAKAVDKILRFGEMSDYSVNGISNLHDLVKELNDVMACIEVLQEDGVVFHGLFDKQAIDEKKAKIRHYLAMSINKHLTVDIKK